MPGLNFKITADDSAIQKTFENIDKMSKKQADRIAKDLDKVLKSKKESINVSDQEKKAVDNVISSVKEEAKAHDKVTEAIKRKNAAFDATGRQIRPVQISNSQDEINAANSGKVGTIAGGPVVGSAMNWNKLANEAASYGNAAKDAHNAAVIGANRSIKSNDDIRKAISSLKIEAQSYRNVAENTKDSARLAEYNNKLKETQAEIARLRNVGKTGFDDLGNKMTVTAGKQEILNNKLRMYQDALNRAKAPQSFVNLNRKIQDTEVQLDRLKNAGRTGFDEMGNSIKKSSGALSGMWQGLKSVANILPGLGIAGLIAFASEPIIDYVKNLSIFKKSLKDTAAESASTSSQYKDAISSISSLKTTIQDYHKGLLTGKQVVKEYNDTIGNTAGELKTIAEVENFYNNKAGAFVDAMFLRAQAAAALEDATNKASEAQKRAIGSNTFMDYVGATGDALTAILTLRGNVSGGFKDALNNFKTRDVDALNKKSKESLKVFEELKLKSDQFNKDNKFVFDMGKTDEIAAKVAAKIIEQRRALQQKIDDINKEYAGKSLTKDEEELQAVRDKFKKIADEAAKFNANPKNKLHLVDASKLKETRDNAINDLVYKQSTEKTKIDLDKQKSLYAEYEDYKTKLGRDAADARFGKEINAYITYLDVLKSKKKEITDIAPEKRTGVQGDYLKWLDNQVNLEVASEKKKYDSLVKEFISYSDQRKALTEKYNADFETLQGNSSAQGIRTTRYQDDLKVLEYNNLKKWDSYKALFDNLEILSRDQVNQRVKDLKNQIDTELLVGKITLDQAKKLRAEINNIGKNKGDGAGLELVIQRLQSVASEISGINSDLSSVVGSLASAAANYISISKDMKTMNDATASDDEKTAAKVGLYAQAANGLLSMITGITNAAAERKRVTEEFYRSATDFQNQYNLSLIEQARLESINKRGIFSKDSLAEIKDGLKASGMAMTEYQKKIDDLYKGQAKVGLRNAVDWKSTGSMVAGGVGAGAAIGSIVPGIGTAIGAVVGGIVGLIGGLFGTKKKKDTYAGLLTEFPELILKSADGTRILNTGLAQQLIAQNQVNDATKQYLQAAIDAEKELASARDQVNEGIKTLVGSIDDDLRNALVDAFKAGEDGMKAFESTVGKSMENIISNLAFQAIFNDAFKELEENMKESFGLGGDSNIVDDLQAFYTLYGSLTKEFDAALTAASEEAKKSGIDIFGKTSGSSKTPNSLEGAYSTASQESINILAGQTSGMRLAQLETNALLSPIGKTSLELLQVGKSKLDRLLKIEQYTGETVTELKSAVSELKAINNKMNTPGNAATAAGY